MFEWMQIPFEGAVLSYPRSVKAYCVDYQFRVAARARHVAATQGKWSAFLAERLRSKHKVVISSRAKIGKRLSLPHPIGIVVGEGVCIGDNVTVYQNVTLGKKGDAYPTIGDGVTIYPNAIVVGGISIGTNATIGAGSVVLKDVPPSTVAAGSPARLIGA